MNLNVNVDRVRRPPVRRRLMLLTSLAFLGAVLFIPFLEAGMPELRANGAFPFEFAGGIALVLVILVWVGLIWSDRASLPMPLLRPWDDGKPTNISRVAKMLIMGLLVGVTLGLCSLFVVRWIGVPNNPGDFVTRVSTTLFGAVVPEVIVHLFALSGLVILFRNRIWPGVLISALVFVALFHGGVVGEGWIVPSAVIALNFTLAVATGALCVIYGFEAALIAHATAHFILLAAS